MHDDCDGGCDSEFGVRAGDDSSVSVLKGSFSYIADADAAIAMDLICPLVLDFVGSKRTKGILNRLVLEGAAALPPYRVACRHRREICLAAPQDLGARTHRLTRIQVSNLTGAKQCVHDVFSPSASQLLHSACSAMCASFRFTCRFLSPTL